MVSGAEIAGYDSISPEVEEVPLRAPLMLPLHLHGPHEPAHTAGAALVGVNLGQEEISQELHMVLRIIGEVTIVSPRESKTSRKYQFEPNSYLQTSLRPG